MSENSPYNRLRASGDRFIPNLANEAMLRVSLDPAHEPVRSAGADQEVRETIDKL